MIGVATSKDYNIKEEEHEKLKEYQGLKKKMEVKAHELGVL